VAVLYSEKRAGAHRFVCTLADDSGVVIPAWMFDAAVCSRMTFGVRSPSIAAPIGNPLRLRAVVLERSLTRRVAQDPFSGAIPAREFHPPQGAPVRTSGHGSVRAETRCGAVPPGRIPIFEQTLHGMFRASGRCGPVSALAP
jgi:hypothetical protein